MFTVDVKQQYHVFLQHTGCKFQKVQFKGSSTFQHVGNSRSTHFLVHFTIEMIENEAGTVPKIDGSQQKTSHRS